MSAEETDSRENKVAELLASVGKGLDQMAADLASMALVLHSAAEAIQRADAAKRASDEAEALREREREDAARQERAIADRVQKGVFLPRQLGRRSP